MKIIIDTKDIKWMPHSMAKGVFIKPIVTKKEFGNEDLTILLVKIPVGASVPKHTHAESEDTLYILEGRAEMFVQSVGNFEVEKGMTIRVPRGREHMLFNVSEDVLVYDVFTPAVI